MYCTKFYGLIKPKCTFTLLERFMKKKERRDNINRQFLWLLSYYLRTDELSFIYNKTETYQSRNTRPGVYFQNGQIFLYQTKIKKNTHFKLYNSVYLLTLIFPCIITLKHLSFSLQNKQMMMKEQRDKFMLCYVCLSGKQWYTTKYLICHTLLKYF